MTTRRTLALALAAVALAGPALAEETTVSHGISAFGELKYAADFPHFDYVNPDAPQSGTMSFRGQLASRTFDSLNAFILLGEPAQGLELLYDTLLVRAFDEPDSVYGQIAETIEYPEDRSWVVFNLRTEARFHDGEQITADDVKFTFETLKAEGLPFYRIQLADVETVTVLSPTKVRVDFAEGARTRDLISDIGQIEILPEHFYDEIDFTRSSLIEPVGSGQYEVFKTDPGRSITYCKVDDYWGEDLPVNIGQDNFDCVRYEYFADNTAAFEALKSGEYLFHEEFTSKIWATSYDFPALETGWVKQDVIPDGRPSGAQGFWFNMRREINQDPRVREAIGMMFNFEWSNDTLFYGLYGRTDSFFENSDLEASGLPEGKELALLEQFRGQLPPEIFTEPAFVPNISSTRQVDRRAVAEAGELLDAAGWTVGPDGMRKNAAGEPLKLNFAYTGGGFERIILPFISNLERLGVEMENDIVDPAQMEERQDRFDFDMTVGRLVPPVTPSPGGLRSIYGSASADAQGSLNFTGQADPVVDALIDAAGDARTREDLAVALRAMDRVMRAKHLWVPNWTKGEHWLAYWDVFGRPEAKPPYIRGDRYWWWDEDKYQALKAQGALR